jgi:hypothetical protein
MRSGSKSDLREAGRISLGIPPSQSQTAYGSFAGGGGGKADGQGGKDGTDLRQTSAYDADPERKDYVLHKLQSPKVKESLNRLCKEIAWTSSTMQKMFEALDLNGDGVLQKVEVQKGLRLMGITLSTMELDAVLRAFDSDGNGTIEFDEFFALMSSHAKEQGLYKLGKEDLNSTEPLIHGFKRGSRVRSLVRLPRTMRDKTKVKLGEELDGYKSGGTVLGPGREDGTVKVLFDISDQAWCVKPNQLQNCEKNVGHDEAAPNRRRVSIA